MNIPAEFNEIRPYTPEELPQIYEELIADPAFRTVVESVMPGVPFEGLAMKMRQCKTNLEFQKAFFYGLLWDLVKKTANGLTFDCSALSDLTRNYTFISNHRDIILDSAFLSILLIDKGMTTVEIAIGDNLLIYPWIHKLVRVNKSFIVKRGLNMRQKLEASALMSRYMHFAMKEKHENLWIAQRQGRAKDSNDRTQDSVLKMMAMAGEGDVTERLKELNIVPLAISYEYDPCDFLKAKELQQKRDDEHFQKSPEDDLINMQTGLYGYKGRIHFQTSACLNHELDELKELNLPKCDLKRTLEHAQNVYFNKDKNYSQGEVNAIVASLNTVINTMRPGNLPEMEDLRPLSALLRRVGTIDDSTDPTLKDAVAFTEMVIKYVADGSGTHDMIETAISRLKSAAGL